MLYPIREPIRRDSLDDELESFAFPRSSCYLCMFAFSTARLDLYNAESKRCLTTILSLGR